MNSRGKRTLGRVLGRVLQQATLQRAHQTTPLLQLEAYAAQPALRALLRLGAWRRARQRARATPAAGRTPVLAAPIDILAPAQSIAAQLRANAHDLEQEVELMRWALARGGYETAEALGAALTPRLGSLPAALRRKALSVLSELAIARGDETLARALWQRHAELPPPALASRLDPGQELSLSMAFPGDAKPNLYLASRLVQAGRLDGDSFARKVLSRPLRWLEQPELELLLHQLKLRADPRDVSSLARYLSRHGLPSCSRAHVEADFLHDLRFGAAKHKVPPGPLISVLMAARNAAHTVDYAVESVLRQTYPNLELVIADDASSDGTLSLLQQRYGADARVRLLSSAQPQGPYNLRNVLLQQARGELVTFHDADDVSLPCRLARQWSALRQSGQVACLSSWLRIRHDGSVVFFADGHAARLSMVSLLSTRAALAAVGPYPSARFGADLDIVRRLALRYGEPTRLREPLLLGLWSSQSLTRTRQAESLESGYRASARRRYSELLFRRDLLGAEAVPAALLQRELERSENYIEPRAVRAL